MFRLFAAYMLIAACTPSSTSSVTTTTRVPETMTAERCRGRGIRPPTPCSSGTIEVPLDHSSPHSTTIELHYERFGYGQDPLIVLHGGPGVGFPFGQILAHSPFGAVLMNRFDIVYFEQRGTGQSARQEEEDAHYLREHLHAYEMSQYIADIELIRKRLFGNIKVTILGSSWGGYLGLAYASSHPDQISAVTLGSFEATAGSTTRGCENFDRAFRRAILDDPSLAHEVSKLVESVESGEITWQPGSEEERIVRVEDLIELFYPFAPKAKYEQLRQILETINAGGTEAQEVIDSLELSEEIQLSIGGSLVGEVSYCQELVSLSLLNEIQNEASTARFCDSAEFAHALLSKCRNLGMDETPVELSSQLSRINFPVLLFAGAFDPIVPVEATLETARNIQNASVIIVERGAHTPISEGGECFAEALERFFRQGNIGVVRCEEETHRL